MTRLARIFVIGILLNVSPLLPAALAHQDKNPPAKQEMKDTGKQTGRAGKSLGRNVKHGRVIHGGKRFGQHMGKAGKHFGKGTAKGVKKAVKP